MKAAKLLLVLFTALLCAVQPGAAAARQAKKHAGTKASVPGKAGRSASAVQKKAPPPLNLIIRGNMQTYYNYYSSITGGTHTVRVLLPEDYASSQESYPVLYMLDGQNLFSPQTSPYGKSWRVGELLSGLYAGNRMRRIVVIGIDAGSDRAFEYTPYKNRDGAGGGAEQYAAFLSREVVPFMETNYRLLRGPENRALAGSSLGGVMALYLAGHRSDVFSNFIAMSPAITWDEGGFFDMVRNSRFAPDVKVWADTGLLEGAYAGGVMGEPLVFARLPPLLEERGLSFGSNLLSYIDDGGVHEESAWSRRLESPLRWFFGGENMKPKRIKSLSSASIAGVVNRVPENILFRGRVAFAGGLEADYIPHEAKASPPYFVWENSSFHLLRGAEPVAVKLIAQWNGKPFSSEVSLVRELPQESAVSFSVRLSTPPPDGLPVYITGSLPQLGGWKADAVRLLRDARNPLLYSVTLQLPRGAGGAWKVTLGSWDRAEKNAAGEDPGDRTVLADRSRVGVSAKVAKFGTPPVQPPVRK